jgi:hypothetical protein
LAALALLASCGNSNSDDAPTAAPTGFAVAPGDTSVVVTWNMEPGLTYWIFSAAAPSITRDNYSRFAGANITQPAVSPQIIGGLANGTTYSFLINATRDGSAAGPATTSIAAVPRRAGETWTVGAPLAADLNAVSFFSGRYLAVGNGGALFSSTTGDGGTWTATPSGVTVNLNGIVGGGLAVAVGDGGTVISSTDGTTWTPQTSGVSTRLNAITVGQGLFVVVGDGGVILRSSDGTTWQPSTSGTTQDLVGVTSLGTTLVALGANGTLLTSPDGVTWTARTTGVTATLRHAAAGASRFVAVGDAGTLITSTDTITWTVQTAPTSQTLRRVVLGSRLVAAGDNGTVLLSDDGLTWTVANSGTTAQLRGLLRGIAFNYVAVGAGGANISSR